MPVFPQFTCAIIWQVAPSGTFCLNKAASSTWNGFSIILSFVVAALHLLGQASLWHCSCLLVSAPSFLRCCAWSWGQEPAVLCMVCVHAFHAYKPILDKHWELMHSTMKTERILVTDVPTPATSGVRWHSGAVVCPLCPLSRYGMGWQVWAAAAFLVSPRQGTIWILSCSSSAELCLG